MIILLIVILFWQTGNLFVDNSATDFKSESSYNTTEMFPAGEELYYDVRYLGLSIGELKFMINRRYNKNGKPVFEASVDIKSNPAIPFVKLSQLYNSVIEGEIYSRFFRGIVRNDDDTTYTDYNFHYEAKKIYMQRGSYTKNEKWIDTIFVADTLLQDGLSIFYFARFHSNSSKKMSVPCFVDEKKVYTKINFYNKTEAIDINAINYDIACVKLDGSTDFVSVFGLTGDFEGWFTKDAASIPIKAKLNVILGSINLELKKWNRSNWTPPAYKK